MTQIYTQIGAEKISVHPRLNDFSRAGAVLNLRNLREAFKKNLRGAFNPLTL